MVEKHSKTQEAVNLVLNKNYSVSQAAEKCKVSPQAIRYSLQKRACKELGICPTCKQKLG